MLSTRPNPCVTLFMSSSLRPRAAAAGQCPSSGLAPPTSIMALIAPPQRYLHAPARSFDGAGGASNPGRLGDGRTGLPTEDDRPLARAHGAATVREREGLDGGGDRSL